MVDEEIEYEPYKLSRSETVAIGRIVTAMAEIEHVITIAMFKILSIDPLDGFVLFGKMTTGQRLGKLRAALRYKNDMILQKTELQKMKHDLDDVTDVRNNVRTRQSNGHKRPDSRLSSYKGPRANRR